MTRQVKSPAQRAQETVDVLQRRIAKLRKQKADLEKQARDVNPEISAVQKRLDYALANPDLPKQPEPDTKPA